MIGISFARSQAWYHPATSSRAVILCQAFGFEELCSRQSMRQLAERIADSGYPVLRFDFPGNADAAGDETDPALANQWRSSVGEAVAWLEANANIQEIVLVGLRLGALIAALEAPKIARLKGLALLAPVSSGRAYIREMRLLAKIMRPPNAVAASDEVAKVIDVCGFLMPEALQAGLTALNIPTPATISGISVLLMKQNGANVDTLAKAYAAGNTVKSVPFVGYDDMICDPMASLVPQSDLATIVEWVTSLGPCPAQSSTRPVPSALRTEHAIERAVTIGPRALAGILTEPLTRNRDATPVIFLNAGLNYHIGWARMHLRMARSLAARGIPSLRFDIAGIGDTMPASGAKDIEIYGQPPQDDFREAVTWLEQQGYVAPLAVGGCSGAYTALRGSLNDPRVQAAIIINLQCFEWTPALGLEVDRWRTIRRNEVTLNRVSHNTGNYAVKLISRSTVFALKAVRACGRIVKRILRAKAADKSNDPVGWFQRFSARGTRIDLVYSENDAGLIALEAVAGKDAQDIISLPGFALHLIPNADHNLTSSISQAYLLNIIINSALSSHLPVQTKKTSAA